MFAVIIIRTRIIVFVFGNRKLRKSWSGSSRIFICFQEVLPHVAIWLKETLRDYYVVGCGRSRELDGEQVAIAFKYKSFNMISMETFWLSPDCFLPGSRYAEQSECPRVCTELVLEDLSERKVFRVLNTHLDHLGAKARQLGLSQILRKLEEERYFAGIPVILAGDFNAEPESDEMEILREHKDYVNLTEGIGSTYHGFSSEEQEESIDYIYVRNGEKTGFSCTSVEKWKDRKGSVWLSDHYPVCVCLEWD
ncbi:hypothetical protein DQQ01_01710 [Blautia argi]|uniref:Endonuclease/exonuclease/phosphatase domain-containing protein n=1 Tax=Blautia argi TaxID=1912897 RepID=A0A2Z4U7W8_9FIRM|nr:hypothetical protein DQQ01_01710 [Blautia argi]